MDPMQVALLITAAIIAVTDLVVFLRLGNEETISVQAYRLVAKYPIIGVALGIVIGHIFWTNQGACQ